MARKPQGVGGSAGGEIEKPKNKDKRGVADKVNTPVDRAIQKRAQQEAVRQAKKAVSERQREIQAPEASFDVSNDIERMRRQQEAAARQEQIELRREAAIAASRGRAGISEDQDRISLGLDKPSGYTPAIYTPGDLLKKPIRGMTPFEQFQQGQLPGQTPKQVSPVTGGPEPVEPWWKAAARNLGLDRLVTDVGKVGQGLKDTGQDLVEDIAPSKKPLPYVPNYGYPKGSTNNPWTPDEELARAEQQREDFMQEQADLARAADKPSADLPYVPNYGYPKGSVNNPFTPDEELARRTPDGDKPGLIPSAIEGAERFNEGTNQWVEQNINEPMAPVDAAAGAIGNKMLGTLRENIQERAVIQQDQDEMVQKALRLIYDPNMTMPENVRWGYIPPGDRVFNQPPEPGIPLMPRQAMEIKSAQADEMVLRWQTEMESEIANARAMENRKASSDFVKDLVSQDVLAPRTAALLNESIDSTFGTPENPVDANTLTTRTFFEQLMTNAENQLYDPEFRQSPEFQAMPPQEGGLIDAMQRMEDVYQASAKKLIDEIKDAEERGDQDRVDALNARLVDLNSKHSNAYARSLASAGMAVIGAGIQGAPRFLRLPTEISQYTNLIVNGVFTTFDDALWKNSRQVLTADPEKFAELKKDMPDSVTLADGTTLRIEMPEDFKSATISPIDLTTISIGAIPGRWLSQAKPADIDIHRWQQMVALLSSDQYAESLLLDKREELEARGDKWGVQFIDQALESDAYRTVDNTFDRLEGLYNLISIPDKRQQQYELGRGYMEEMEKMKKNVAGLIIIEDEVAATRWNNLAQQAQHAGSMVEMFEKSNPHMWMDGYVNGMQLAAEIWRPSLVFDYVIPTAFSAFKYAPAQRRAAASLDQYGVTAGLKAGTAIPAGTFDNAVEANAYFGELTPDGLELNDVIEQSHGPQASDSGVLPTSVTTENEARVFLRPHREGDVVAERQPFAAGSEATTFAEATQTTVPVRLGAVVGVDSEGYVIYTRPGGKGATISEKDIVTPRTEVAEQAIIVGENEPVWIDDKVIVKTEKGAREGVVTGAGSTPQEVRVRFDNRKTDATVRTQDVSPKTSGLYKEKPRTPKPTGPARPDNEPDVVPEVKTEALGVAGTKRKGNKTVEIFIGDEVRFKEGSVSGAGKVLGPGKKEGTVLVELPSGGKMQVTTKNVNPLRDPNTGVGRTLKQQAWERHRITAAKRSNDALKQLGSVFHLVETAEDALAITRALMTDVVSVRRGLLSKWTGDIFKTITQGGKLPLRVGTDVLAVDRGIFEAMTVLERMGPDEFISGSNVLNTVKGKLSDADKIALMHEFRDAIYLQSAREFGDTFSDYRSSPFGAVSARIKDGTRTVVEFLNKEGNVIGNRTMLNATHAEALVSNVELVGRPNGIQKLYRDNIVSKTGAAIRGVESYLYMGWSPSAFINNFVNPLFYSLTDKSKFFNRKRPWRLETRENMMAHLTKLYEGLAGIDERFMSELGETEYMGGKPAEGGKGWLKEGPMRKFIRENEKDMALRSYYDGVRSLIEKFGRDVVDKQIIPDLQRYAYLTPEQATRIGNVFYDSAVSGGSATALRNALAEVDANMHYMTLSDIDPTWFSYMPPLVAEVFSDIMRTSVSPEHMARRIAKLLDDVRAVKDESLLYNPAPEGRHVNTVTTLTAELADFETNLRRAQLTPEEAAVYRNRFIESQRAYTKARSGLAELSKNAQTRNGAMWLYESWKRVRDERTKVEADVDKIMEEAALSRQQNPNAWKEAFPEVARLWDEFYNETAPAIYTEAAEAARNGTPPPDGLDRGPDYIDWSALNEKDFFEIVNSPTGTPGVDPRFAEARDAGRKLHDLAVARMYAAGVQYGIDPQVVLDYVMSAERDVGAMAAELRALQQEAYDEIAAGPRLSKGEFDTKWNAIRNATWQEFYAKTWDRYQKGMREMIEPQVGKGVKEGKKAIALDQAMDNLNKGIISAMVTPENATRLINSIRAKLGEAGIPSMTPGRTYVTKAKVATVTGKIGRANFARKLAEGFNLTAEDAEVMASLTDFIAARWSESMGIDNLDTFYQTYFNDIVRGGSPGKSALFSMLVNGKFADGLIQLNNMMDQSRQFGSWKYGGKDYFPTFQKYMASLPDSIIRWLDNEYIWDNGELVFRGPAHPDTVRRGGAADAFVAHSPDNRQGATAHFTARGLSPVDSRGVNTVWHEQVHMVWDDLYAKGAITKELIDTWYEQSMENTRWLVANDIAEALVVMENNKGSYGSITRWFEAKYPDLDKETIASFADVVQRVDYTRREVSRSGIQPNVDRQWNSWAAAPLDSGLANFYGIIDGQAGSIQIANAVFESMNVRPDKRFSLEEPVAYAFGQQDAEVFNILSQLGQPIDRYSNAWVPSTVLWDENGDLDMNFISAVQSITPPTTPGFNEFINGSVVTNPDGSAKMVWFASTEKFGYGTLEAADQPRDTYATDADFGGSGGETWHTGFVRLVENPRLLRRGISQAQFQALPAYVSLTNPFDMDATITVAQARQMLADQSVLPRSYIDIQLKRNPLLDEAVTKKMTGRQFVSDVLQRMVVANNIASTLNPSFTTVADVISDLGYDGYMMKDPWNNPGMLYGVLESNQVKSALDNTGRFDLFERDILLSSGKFNDMGEWTPYVNHMTGGTVTLRGSTEFLDNASAILRGLSSPDRTTGMHELGHVFRRVYYDMARNGDDAAIRNVAALEKHYKVDPKTGWTRELEERFVKDWEIYLKSGKAPVDGLKTIFAKISEWMKEVYGRLSGYRNLSPTMKAVFDDMLSPSREAQETFLYGNRRLPRGSAVLTPLGMGNVVSNARADAAALRPRTTVVNAAGETQRFNFSDVTPQEVVTRRNMPPFVEKGRERPIAVLDTGERVIAGDSVWWEDKPIKQKPTGESKRRRRLTGVVMSYEPKTDSFIVSVKSVTAKGTSSSNFKVKRNAVVQHSGTGTAGDVPAPGSGGLGTERVTYEVKTAPGFPFDKAILAALNKQLEHMGIGKLTDVGNLSQLDPKLLPFLEQVADMYASRKQIEADMASGEYGPGTASAAAYREKLDSFRKMNEGNPQVKNGDEPISQGGISLYEMEAIESFARKAQARGSEMFDRATLPGQKLTTKQAMDATTYLTQFGLPAWQNLMAAAAENGNKMRSLQSIDFLNQTRVDDVVSLVAPYHFWKTRTIKNSLERMITEPGYFFHLYKLEQALRNQAPQSYEEEQQQQLMREAAESGIAGEQSGFVRPPRLAQYVKLPFGLSKYDLYLRWLPSNVWPMFPHFISNDFTGGGRIPGNEETNAADRLWQFSQGGTISMHPFVNDLIEWNHNRGLPAAEQNFQFRPAEYSQQTSILAPAAALQFMDPSEWPTYGRYLFLPNTEYYVARALSNAAERGEIDGQTMGGAAQWLHHTKYGSELPPEWALIDQEKVFEALRNAAHETVMVSSTEQISRLMTSVTLKAHDATEDKIRADRAQFTAAFYGSLLDPEVVNNPFGTNIAAYNLRNAHPGIEARSQAGDMFRPEEMPMEGTLRTMKYNEGREFQERLRAAEASAVEALQEQDPYASSKDVSVAKLNAVLPIYEEILGKPAIEKWLSGQDSVLDAAFDLRTLQTAVYDQIDAKYPSLQEKAQGVAQQEQRPQALQNPLEVEFEGIKKALKSMWEVPGRPDYDDMVSKGGNYDDYSEAMLDYEEKQIQYVMEKGKLTHSQAAKQIEVYKERNMSPAERKLRKREDEENARMEPWWDVYATLPKGTKDDFMKDPANREFAEYYARELGNWWDDNENNDEGRKRLAEASYGLPAGYGGAAGPLGNGASGGVLPPTTPEKGEAKEVNLDKDWDAWNALPSKNKEAAAEFMAQHPKFAEMYETQYGNYWDDNPNNDIGEREIATEPPRKEKVVDHKLWDEYMLATPEGKAKLLLENESFRKAYLLTNKDGWFYWYLGSDGKFKTADEKKGGGFVKDGKPFIDKTGKYYDPKFSGQMDEYFKIPKDDWEAKKQYMLDNPEFAAYYKKRYGKAWWEEEFTPYEKGGRRGRGSDTERPSVHRPPWFSRLAGGGGGTGAAGQGGDGSGGGGFIQAPDPFRMPYRQPPQSYTPNLRDVGVQQSGLLTGLSKELQPQGLSRDLWFDAADIFRNRRQG